MTEKLHQKNNSESMEENWNFSDVPFTPDKTNIDGDVETVSDAEIEEMLGEIEPFIERVEPEMLKKVFDGWKKRQNHYRQLIREEESVAELDDRKRDLVADMFYMGTIFRDYLDSILGLKGQEKSGFQLYDSLDPEVEEYGLSAGAYNRYENTVNMIGDRFDTKLDYLAAIGHEMWHAHQKQVADDDGERAKVYEASFSSYVDPKDNYEKYITQPVELEAQIFEHRLRDKIRDAMALSPIMQNDLTKKIRWNN